MEKIISKYWRKLKSLFRPRKQKSPQQPNPVLGSNRRSRQPDMHILSTPDSMDLIAANRKISRSSLSTAVQSTNYEEVYYPSHTNPSNYYGTPKTFSNRALDDEINIGSGFELNSNVNYMPSIVREEDVPADNHSSGESYNRSMNRSLGRKKAGQTLVQELERKKSIKRAALEPVRNPNVTTLIDVTPPILIKKGTLLDSSCSLSRSKSRSRGNPKISTDEGLIRSKSKSRKAKHNSAGLLDSGLSFNGKSTLTSEYPSGNSLSSNRTASYVNNTSDESEDRSFDLQRKFLASTDGLTRKTTHSTINSNSEPPSNLSRKNSKRVLKEKSPDEVQLSRSKSMRRNPSLADSRVDSYLSRSRSIRNQESLSRRKSKQRIVVANSSDDDDDIPLGLTIRR